MPRPLNLLSDVRCKRIAAGDRTLYDGGGLMLVPDGRGTGLWRLKYQRRLAGGGRYPAVSLAAARKWRDEFKAALRDGHSPVDEKRAAKASAKVERAKVKHEASNTLQAFAEAHHARIAGQFRNVKHRAQWLASLRPVFDALGDKPLSEITETDVLDVLAPIIAATPETGARVKQRLRAVFDAAKLRKLVPYNVVREVASAAELKRPRHVGKHLPALPHADVHAFIVELRAFERAAPAVRMCLEFLVLTATRSGEARGARWSEIDEAAKTWTIPAERTKRHREHVVPLSRAALAVLKRARDLDGEELVFPSPARLDEEGELSDMVLSMTMRRMSLGAVPHGFRSGFAGWARACTNIRDEAIERALAHVEENKVKAAYMRDDFIVERRKLMDGWGAYVSTAPKLGVKVVPFPHARAS